MNNEICTASVDKLKFEREFVYDKILLLKLTMQYFKVNISKRSTSEYKINNYIQKQTEEFYKYASETLIKQAYIQYQDSIKNGFPFNNYEAMLVYNITLNNYCFFSFYSDKYEYTGGAHGLTTKSSATFNLCNGKKIPLFAYFDTKNYQELLIKLIQMIAEENYIANPGIYFENYKELISENFNPESYFLTENSISIYYQQYEIAPYSTGIVVFEIPYSVAACPPSC